MNSRLTLQEWADFLARKHQEFYIDKPRGELVPMFFLDRADGEMEIHVAAWRDNMEKVMMAEAISLRLRDPIYTRYAMASEVWTIRSKTGLSDSAMAAAYAGKLYEHPDRVGAVSTFCIDRALPDQPVMIMQEIIRGRSGGVRLLKRIEDPGADSIRGRMAELFGEPTRQ